MPIFVEVLLGVDAEIVGTIFDVVLLLDVVGFDEPILFVVLLLAEVDVIIGLDVADFQQFLTRKVWSEMPCAFSSMMFFSLM